MKTRLEMKHSGKQLSKVKEEIRKDAGELLAEGTNAIEFSERFFGPSGRLCELWNNEAERKAVVTSELFKWLQDRLAELRMREASAFSEEVAQLSGRLTVVVPRSLHASLKREAAVEGVSLSELMRLKLSVALASVAGNTLIGMLTRLTFRNPFQVGRAAMSAPPGRTPACPGVR